MGKRGKEWIKQTKQTPWPLVCEKTIPTEKGLKEEKKLVFAWKC
jgi:hypothetical protein